ncbi:MAG: hypothetical protein U0787_20460 [Polyangia bacterium]
MRAASWVWLSLCLSILPLGFAQAAFPTKNPVVTRKNVAMPRPRAVASVPREESRPAREDRGRIETRLVAARSEYADVRYAASVLLLLRVLAETQPSLDQQIQVFDLLAACYVALGQIELAVGSFGEVLHRRPDFALDPVKTSPKVRAALEQARSRL